MDASTLDPTAVAAALATEQDQVAALLDRLPDPSFDDELPPLALERLLVLGHFPEYSAELDWTPREIAGHLRDSARVFTERILRVRGQDRPTLEDFVTDDPTRVEEYGATERATLRRQLDDAQAALRDAVAAVPPDELDRTAVHETDGPVTLADLLVFLPDHQRDHREQLAAFAAAPF